MQAQNWHDAGHKRGMVSRIWLADHQFDTPSVWDCAVHLKNSVQYASILQ